MGGEAIGQTTTLFMQFSFPNVSGITDMVLICSFLTNYPGLCLGHSVSSKVPNVWLLNERENVLVSSM